MHFSQAPWTGDADTVKGQTYPAAQSAAPKIHSLFAAHAAEARRRGQVNIATLPEIETIEAIIGAAFWASLRREEGYWPKISLAFLAPHEASHPLLFERPLPLDAAPLTRVAPAVERAGIHLGIWPDGGELSVWGTTSSIPATCFVVEVAAPGLLVVKHHRGGESGQVRQRRRARGRSDQDRRPGRASPPDRPALLSSLVGFDSMASWGDSVNILVQLAVSMRAHGRGGLLLVVPPGTDGWRESIVRPIAYAVTPPFAELAELCHGAPADRQRREWRESLARVVHSVAGLTAVDGATIMTSEYELLAFGAKIARRKGWPQIDQVTVTEPIEGAVHRLVDPTELGGTRHLSAAQFVHDQPRRPGVRRVARRPVHGVRVVSRADDGPCAPGRGAAALTARCWPDRITSRGHRAEAGLFSVTSVISVVRPRDISSINNAEPFWLERAGGSSRVRWS